MNIIKNHLSKKYHYYVCCASIFIIIYISFFANGIFPFGNSTFASYDMLAQVSPFLEHLFDFFSGKSGLFHTFSLMGGMDMFGSVAYSLVSPFSFVFLIFGKGNVFYSLSIVFPLKICVIAVSSLYFLDAYFKNLTKPYKLVLSLLYSFCGYIFFANTYIIWLDLLIYLPIMASGFIDLINENKTIKLSISLSLCVYASFSISCLSWFLIFPIMCAYMIFNFKGSQRKLKLTYLFIAFLRSLIIILPIIIPSFSAFMQSGRKSGIFDKILTNNIAYDYALAKKFTYVLCDATLVAITVIALISKLLPKEKKYFILTALIILLIPCVIDDSMLLLNGGEYYSYALRFGFLISFFLFVVSSYYLNIYLSNDVTEQTKLTKKQIGLNIILTTITAVLSIFLVVFFNLIAYGKLSKNIIFKNIMPSFAHSEGGLGASVPTFIISVILITVASLLIKLKILRLKNLAPIISIFLVSTSIFFTFCMTNGNVNNYSIRKYEYYTELLKDIEKDDQEYFRYKNFRDYISSDAPLTLGTNSFSCFSSMLDKQNIKVTNFFGYNGNKKNSIKSDGGTFLGDCLLGYKYQFFTNGENDTTNHKSYTSRNYLSQELHKYNGFSVYRNLYSFPSAIKVTDNSFVANSTDTKCDILDSFYTYLTGEESSLFNYVYYKVTKKEDCFLLTTLSSVIIEGDLYLDSHFPKEYNVYYKKYSDGKKEPLNDSVYLKYDFGSTNNIYLYCDNQLINEDIIKEYVSFKIIKVQNVESLYNKIKDNEVKISLSKNTITTEKFTASSNQQLYLNFVNLDGYKVYVNGKEKQFLPNEFNFMSIPLEDGENQVVIKYTSNYLITMLICLFISILLLLALHFLFKNKQFIEKYLSVIISPLMILVAFILVLVFLIFPTVLFFVKLIF